MFDLRNFKMPDGKEWYTKNTIKKEIVTKDIIKQKYDEKEIRRLKNISKLLPFKDADNDKIPNVFDKRPFVKDKKSKWGLKL